MTLTFGLVVLALAVLPSLGALPEMEAENYSVLEQVETDDDLQAGAAWGTSSAGGALSMAAATRLNGRLAVLSVILPPPNQA